MMPSRPADPVDEELRRALADPGVSARLDAYLERRRRGELEPGIRHEEVGRRLGLLDKNETTAWRGEMAEMAIGDDPDVRWLLDLLALLPAMTLGAMRLPQRRVDPNLDATEVEERGAEWWERYAKVHVEPYGRIPEGTYYRGHLFPWALKIVRGEADLEDVRRLAEYCLLFFDVADRPECYELLEEVVVNSFTPQPSGSCGRRWAQSVIDVAWRLWVRGAARDRFGEDLAAWPRGVAAE
jgi:hypothetical protein